MFIWTLGDVFGLCFLVLFALIAGGFAVSDWWHERKRKK